jgi:hypothetical protein
MILISREELWQSCCWSCGSGNTAKLSERVTRHWQPVDERFECEQYKFKGDIVMINNSKNWLPILPVCDSAVSPGFDAQDLRSASHRCDTLSGGNIRAIAGQEFNCPGSRNRSWVRRSHGATGHQMPFYDLSYFGAACTDAALRISDFGETTWHWVQPSCARRSGLSVKIGALTPSHSVMPVRCGEITGRKPTRRFGESGL